MRPVASFDEKQDIVPDPPHRDRQLRKGKGYVFPDRPAVSIIIQNSSSAVAVLPAARLCGILMPSWLHGLFVPP
jgi:hypothetical protein